MLYGYLVDGRNVIVNVQKGSDQFQYTILKDGAIGVEIQQFEKVVVKGTINDSATREIDTLDDQLTYEFQKL